MALEGEILERTEGVEPVSASLEGCYSPPSSPQNAKSRRPFDQAAMLSRKVHAATYDKSNYNDSTNNVKRFVCW